MYTCVWGRRNGRPSSDIESRRVEASGATYMNYVHSLSLEIHRLIGRRDMVSFGFKIQKLTQKLKVSVKP